MKNKSAKLKNKYPPMAIESHPSFEKFKSSYKATQNFLRLTHLKVLNVGLNHHCYFPGIWFTFNGTRYKDYYDLELVDGRIMKCMYPNANAWHSGDGVRVQDADVVRLRQLPNDELPKHYAYKSEEEKYQTLFETHNGLHPKYLINDEGGLIAILDERG